jgi:hypothetical protein
VCVPVGGAYTTSPVMNRCRALHFRGMLVGHDGSTGGRNGLAGVSSVRFGLQNRHFFRFAFLLGLNDGNVLTGGVKGRTDLAFLVRHGQGVFRFQTFHEIVDVNAKGLFARLDLTIQKGNIRLLLCFCSCPPPTTRK